VLRVQIQEVRHRESRVDRAEAASRHRTRISGLGWAGGDAGGGARAGPSGSGVSGKWRGGSRHGSSTATGREP